jgi:hypothetical protein
MKRMVTVLFLAVLMALPNASVVMASGGANPLAPVGTVITGPTILATVVVDPHIKARELQQGQPEFGWPASIRLATFKLRSGFDYSGAAFDIPMAFPLWWGCQLVVGPEHGYPSNTNLTALRFLNQPLIEWVPENILSAVLQDLGIALDPNKTPIITHLENVVCTPAPAECADITTWDPEAEQRPCGTAGMLNFNAVIQFKVNK